MILIKLLSNHGSPDKTQISSITVLDHKNNPIPVLQAGIVIPHGIKEYCHKNNIQLFHKNSQTDDAKKDPYNVISLFDGVIVKTKENSLFSLPFSLPLVTKTSDEDDPILAAKNKQLLSDNISLILFVESSCHVDGIRLFNTSFDPEAGIKNISVKLTTTNVEETFEVPKMFGADHKFPKEEENESADQPSMLSVLVPESQQPQNVLRDLFPHSYQTPNTISDDYGLYPFPHAQSLQFEILQTYDENDIKIGLNGLELYNDSLERITMKDIKSIVIKNANSKNANNEVLIKDQMITSNDVDMFVIERPIRNRFSTLSLPQNDSDENEDENDNTNVTQNPIIMIIFKKPMKLSKIVVWNYNSCTESNLRGVAKASIKLDGRPFWTGMVKKSAGCINNMEKHITHIWMHDSKNSRAKQELDFINQCASIEEYL